MAGKKGFGAILEYDSGGAVYVAIANITKMRPFGLKADVIDTTSMASASETREKLPGLIDSGELQVDLNYDHTSVSGIWLKANVGVVVNYRINMPPVGGATVKAIVSGFITSLTPEVPHDNKMTCSAVIAITGAIPVFA